MRRSSRRPSRCWWTSGPSGAVLARWWHPILDEIAADHAGKLRIGKINIDENLELARRFDVMSIPTMILFKDGEPQLRIIGAKGKGQLLQELHPLPVTARRPTPADSCPHL